MQRVAFVPEGQADSSQAPIAWVACREGMLALILAEIHSIVALGRGYFPHNPGTSCLATIVLSLWDEDVLRAEALIKLKLVGVNPG
jgi:hypothetical protein